MTEQKRLIVFGITHIRPFSDTQDGAEASMKVYTMIETVKANDLDPQKYLSFLLEHRPNAKMSDDELEQLAPWSKLAQETCK